MKYFGHAYAKNPLILLNGNDLKSVPNIVQNTKIAHHSNSLNADWSTTAQTIVQTILDQVGGLDFQLGPDLDDEQFFDDCMYLDWETLTAIYFSIYI